MTLLIGRQRLTLARLRSVARQSVRVALDPACLPAIEAGAAAVERLAAQGEPAYGINSGFGKLAQTRIPREALSQLQRNLVLSHAAGTGPLLSDEAVRLTLTLKIASLSSGHSGVRPKLIEALVQLYEKRIYPCIPCKGSVGASGDLAPLAHLAGALIGVGEVRRGGTTVPAASVIEPIELGPKEGLALLNGTQVSTALALIGLFAIEDVFAAALAAGALSVDAAMGSDAPFDPRIHELRGHPGQIDCAARYRELLAGSAIRASHLKGDDRVQDPYSLRCQPQVMGACLGSIRDAARVLETEANGVTDNPLVFADTGEALSGGNFHGEPVALAADALAIAAAEIGALSERRIALLIDASISRLPPFLVEHGGLNSGFMVAQVSAAALASENKALAHPASVDSLPTSANQEDHVSMATFAARRLAEIADNCAGIVAIELLAAAQGLDFRAPLETSSELQEVHRAIRGRIAFYREDRYFAPDIAAAKALVVSGAFNRHAAQLLPSLC
ncbi:MAG: histidine ammonia-lyase [Burkholderiales bacterium]|nr:histidine ammonia-lyase [Burkholderiales bacterium]